MAFASTAQKIPPEILTYICLINANRGWTPFSPHPYDTPTGLPPAILDTIRASHVCHRWRSILISSPELWMNMVDPYDVDWARVVLERSRPFGVRLVPPRSKRSYFQPWKFYKSEAVAHEIRNRVVEYRFTQTTGSRCLFLRNDLPSHFDLPRLHFLYLDLSPSQRLPDEFLGSVVPVLKRLHLRRRSIDSIHQLDSVSTTLTHLTIADLHPNRKIPPFEMVTLIKRLPNLQSVTLRNALTSRPLIDSAPKEIHLLEFSLADSLKCTQLFFECAEFAPPLNKFSLYCDQEYGDQWDSLYDIIPNVTQVFDMFFSHAFERCRVHIAPGEITYTSLWNPSIYESRPDERIFHFHSHLIALSSMSFEDLIYNFLPSWSRDKVEHLIIPPAAFNLFHLEFGEEYVVRVLCQLSNVRILGGVGPVLWDLLYRCSESLDCALFPSLREIELHRDSVPSTLEMDGDSCASVLSDNDSEEDEEEDIEDKERNLATGTFALTQEVQYPDSSDAEDESFVYSSENRDISDSEYSTDALEPSELRANIFEDATSEMVAYYDHEYKDVIKGHINIREILEFCSSRPTLRKIVISNTEVADDKDVGFLRMALERLGVSVEIRSDLGE